LGAGCGFAGGLIVSLVILCGFKILQGCKKISVVRNPLLSVCDGRWRGSPAWFLPVLRFGGCPVLSRSVMFGGRPRGGSDINYGWFVQFFGEPSVTNLNKLVQCFWCHFGF
jgi:hypothetical protein